MLPSKVNGFTLVELVIVIAIIGILASLAYPAYTEQIRKGRRAEAKSALLDIASRQERYRSDFGFYGDVDDITGSLVNNIDSESGYYNITIACVPDCNPGLRPQSYTATATTQIADPQCGNYTYNEAGTITISGTDAPNITRCW